LYVDAADLREFSDDELIALIERLDTDGHDHGELVTALDELFRRIRAEAEPDERSYVEEAITRLKSTFGHDGDDHGPDVCGVREPRRPPPSFDASTVRLAS
jgi:hypothetical protein